MEVVAELKSRIAEIQKDIQVNKSFQKIHSVINVFSFLWQVSLNDFSVRLILIYPMLMNGR